MEQLIGKEIVREENRDTTKISFQLFKLFFGFRESIFYNIDF